MSSEETGSRQTSPPPHIEFHLILSYISMAYIKRQFAINGIYHILNRGVDKRRIFLHQLDYLRFVHDLFEFNDAAPLTHTAYSFSKSSETRKPIYTHKEKKPRKFLVEILSFCLMPNHYHLLLLQKTEGGVVKFIKRLNMGYAKYFNEKYKRAGTLFQGRYKAVPVTTEAHFIHLPYYIHANPLDLVMPEWREANLANVNQAWEYLENYRWSSHRDYLGIKNFPSVTQREFLREILGDSKRYETEFKKWLRDISLEPISEKLLE